MYSLFAIRERGSSNVKDRLCPYSGTMMFWMHIQSEQHLIQIETEWDKTQSPAPVSFLWWSLMWHSHINFHRLRSSKKTSFHYQFIWLASLLNMIFILFIYLIIRWLIKFAIENSETSFTLIILIRPKSSDVPYRYIKIEESKKLVKNYFMCIILII